MYGVSLSIPAARGHEPKTMPDAMKGKLQEIEQGEFEDGAFDKGAIAETISDRITSGEYEEEEFAEETVEAFARLITDLSAAL